MRKVYEKDLVVGKKYYYGRRNRHIYVYLGRHFDDINYRWEIHVRESTSEDISMVKHDPMDEYYEVSIKFGR